LKLYKEAVAYFQDSHRFCGEHHISWYCVCVRVLSGFVTLHRSGTPRYNMGICYNYTDELDKSLSCFARSLELRPEYHDALQWKLRISARISDGAIGEGRPSSDVKGADSASGSLTPTPPQ
jgi:tetratricopeptide (TPR) repeat protein